MTKIDRRSALLAAVRKAGGKWVNRSQLAADTDKTRLSPNDVRWLEKLTAEGLIEARKTPIAGPIGYEWEYRAVESEGK